MNTKTGMKTILLLASLCVPTSNAFSQSTSGTHAAAPGVAAPKVYVPINIYGRPFFTSGSQVHRATPEQLAAAQAQESAYRDAMAHAQSLLKSGDARGAQAAFRQALVIQVNDGSAQVGLAEAYTAAGQTDLALATYRALFYHIGGSDGGGSVETDPAVLMRFALLLQQAGQGEEAVSVYNRGVGFLDFEAHGEPRLSTPVPLPQIGNGPNQVPYDPQFLEAMAHLAIGVEANEDNEWRNNVKQAVTLAPASAAANYYMGRYLLGRDDVQAKAYLQEAVRLGDDQTQAAAKVYLSILN